MDQVHSLRIRGRALNLGPPIGHSMSQTIGTEPGLTLGELQELVHPVVRKRSGRQEARSATQI